MLAVESVPTLDPDRVARDAADSHWVCRDGQGRVTGRCSLWWQHTPRYLDHRVGIIGHYAASNGSAARRVLDYACAQLTARGCTIAIGPMDGNTWRQYRLVTDRGREPPFFLEPDNPADWPVHFVENGFEALAHYFSAVSTSLETQVERWDAVARRMALLGVHIRPLDPERSDDELRRIYSVATIAFRRNFLYTPITQAEFIAQYRALRPLMTLDFVFIAEQHDEPVGFVFGMPDLLEARRGERIKTVIVKSLAVLPGRRYAGLGNLLLARVQALAHELGYARVIFGLIRDVAHLRRTSDRYARRMRSYTLYSRVLWP